MKYEVLESFSVYDVKLKTDIVFKKGEKIDSEKSVIPLENFSKHLKEIANS